MKEGVHKISFEDYLADPCPEPSLSRSSIVQILDCPAKAFYGHPRLNQQPPEEKDESKFGTGSAAHDLLLEGGHNIMVIEGFDDWRKGAAKEAREAAREIGKTPLLTKQFDIVSAMVEAAKKQIRECSELGITDLSTEGDAELSYLWQEKNGVWCRIRPDWIKKDRTLCIDYKTSGTSANPDEFSGHMTRMNYHIQSVFYRRGIKAIDEKNADFVFIAQENEPPYLCSFNGIDLQNEEMAEDQVRQAIRMWRYCLDTGEWPGYPKRVCYAEAAPWEIAKWELKKGRIEEAK